MRVRNTTLNRTIAALSVLVCTTVAGLGVSQAHIEAARIAHCTSEGDKLEFIKHDDESSILPTDQINQVQDTTRIQLRRQINNLATMDFDVTCAYWAFAIDAVNNRVYMSELFIFNEDSPDRLVLGEQMFDDDDMEFRDGGSEQQLVNLAQRLSQHPGQRKFTDTTPVEVIVVPNGHEMSNKGPEAYLTYHNGQRPSPAELALPVLQLNVAPEWVSVGSDDGDGDGDGE